MNLTKFLLTIFSLALLSNNGISQPNNWEYKFENEVNKKIIKSYVDKGLIDKNETVIAYFRLNTDGYTGGLAMEFATILTHKRVIDYQLVGESVIKKTILLDNILKLELNDQKTNIYVSINQGVIHNEKFTEDRLSKNGAILSSVMKDKSKGQEFYMLLDKHWKLSSSYSNNQQVYKEFFDNNGNYIPRPSDRFRLKKMEELKSILDSSSLNTFRYSAYIYYFNENIIYEIDFDRDQENYSVLRLKVSDSQKDGKNNTSLFLNYKYVIKEKYNLPYKTRGIEYFRADELVTNKIEDLISYMIGT